MLNAAGNLLGKKDERKKSTGRKKESAKKVSKEMDAEEKHMMKFMKKLRELSENDFVVESVLVPLQTHNDSRIKLMYENIVSAAPQCAATSIDLGDQVLAINGKEVNNAEEARGIMRDIKKEVLRESGGKRVDFDVQITRKRLKRLKPSQQPKTKVSEDLPKGFEYFEALLVLYPNSTIGFNVKPGLNNRCMVSSVDGGWKSLAKKIFQVGDILLYISGKDGQEVNSVAAAKSALTKYAKGSVIRVWFARAKDPICVKQVRSALLQDRTQPTADPRMAADCYDIVKEELDAMDYRQKKKMIVPEVVKEMDENEKRRIDFRKISKFAKIGIEAHVNPHHLSLVPARVQKKPVSSSPATSPTATSPVAAAAATPPPPAPPPVPRPTISGSKEKEDSSNRKTKKKEEKDDSKKAHKKVSDKEDKSTKKKRVSKEDHSGKKVKKDDYHVKSKYIAPDMNRPCITNSLMGPPMTPP